MYDLSLQGSFSWACLFLKTQCLHVGVDSVSKTWAIEIWMIKPGKTVHNRLNQGRKPVLRFLFQSILPTNLSSGKQGYIKSVQFHFSMSFPRSEWEIQSIIIVLVNSTVVKKSEALSLCRLVSKLKLKWLFLFLELTVKIERIQFDWQQMLLLLTLEKCIIWRQEWMQFQRKGWSVASLFMVCCIRCRM